MTARRTRNKFYLIQTRTPNTWVDHELFSPVHQALITTYMSSVVSETPIKVEDEDADPVGDGSDQENEKGSQKHLNKVKTLLNRIEILSGNEFFDTQDRARLMNIVKKMLQGDHVPYNHVYIVINMMLQLLEFLEHDSMVVMRLVSYLKNKGKFDY